MRFPACFLALAVLAGAAWAGTERFGIFAGHNQGRNREALRFAERDAERIAGILHQIGGMKEENALILKSPSREALVRAMQDLSAKAGRLPAGSDAVFFLYFSGHGDDRSLFLGGEDMPLGELKALFDGFPAKLRIGVFDACQSGAITRIKGARVVAPFVHSHGVNGEGNIYITSSGGDENSQEADHLEGSFFTHHLASGLRGAADANGDRRVSILEAYNYAFNHTVAETGGTRGGTQHPNARFRMDMEGDVVITDVGAGASALRIGKGAQGEYLILDHNQSVMAEVNKDSRLEVIVALEPRNYLVFKKEGGAIRRAEVSLEAGSILDLDERSMRKHSGHGGKVKGWAASASHGPAPRTEPPTRRPEAPKATDASPVRLELGLGFWEGTTYTGGLVYSPFPYAAIHLQYSVLTPGGGQLHWAKAGIEAALPLTPRILAYSRGFAAIGRANDDEAMPYRETILYACPENAASGPVCGESYERIRRGYRTVRGGNLELGGRFHLGRNLALSAATGLDIYRETLHFEGLSKYRGIEIQPLLLGVQTWF